MWFWDPKMQLLLLCCLLSGAAPWWHTETSGVASFPLMSKRTTSMLITTKCAKFWLIIRALCGGSDERRLSAFLKTVHQALGRRRVPGGPGHMVGITVMALNLWLQPLTREMEPTHMEEGVLWRKPRDKASAVAFGVRAALVDYCLSSLFTCTLPLSSRREQFCVRSQEPSMHSVPKGWAETGKKLVRTSAVSLPSTRQKPLRHGGDGAVGGFESRSRRMNVLTHVGTSCLFPSVCLWLLSRGIKHIVIGPSRAVWKIRRMKHLFGTSWCTLRAGLNMV